MLRHDLGELGGLEAAHDRSPQTRDPGHPPQPGPAQVHVPELGRRHVEGINGAAFERHSGCLRPPEVEFLDDAIREEHVGELCGTEIHESELAAAHHHAVPRAVVELAGADPRRNELHVPEPRARSAKAGRSEPFDPRFDEGRPGEVRAVKRGAVERTFDKGDTGEAAIGEVNPVERETLGPLARPEVAGIACVEAPEAQLGQPGTCGVLARTHPPIVAPP